MIDGPRRSYQRPLGFLLRGLRPRGVSLIELMVAMAIGLVLIAGLALMFSNTSHTGAELEKSSRQIENGRYALDLLSEDVSMAGYYGELQPNHMTLVASAACATTLVDLGWNGATDSGPFPITGYSATEAAALPCLSNHKAGTAALAVRRVDTTALPAAGATDGNFHLQTSRCSMDPSAPRFIVSTVAADFTLRSLPCTGASTVNRHITRIYYVAGCNECGRDMVPTLKRAELLAGRIVIAPIAEGIEEVTFDYAFDTDGNATPDIYQTGLSVVAGAGTWANVVGVRINLLTRSTEPSTGFSEEKTFSMGLAGMRGPFRDGFKRRAYTLTSRLNNVAGPRE